MSNKVKEFIIKITIYLVTLSIFLIAFNLQIDPFGLFRRDFSKQRYSPNQHFIKIKLLLAKKIKKNSFIFGSSRVGKIYVTKNKHTKNYYNMTYSNGVPYEHLQDIKILLNHGIEIRNIIIGMDNITYLLESKPRLDSPMRYPYPESKFELFILYMRYLNTPRYFFIWREPNKEASMYYDMYNSGNPIVLERDKWIETHKIEHNKDKKFLIPTWGDFYKERINLTIEEIKGIKDICGKNKINLIIFINPMHQVTYKRQNMADYFRFLRELSYITDYFDFSGINKITTNNYYYYETSHYRPIVGDMIINRIFGENKDDDFGFFVTSKNVEEHILKLQNEYPR